MPFTINGDWIPESPLLQTKNPVKVFKEKRRSSSVTLISNLFFDKEELKNFCSALKKHLGCGGSLKNDKIELQGDQVDQVKSYLKNSGIHIK